MPETLEFGPPEPLPTRKVAILICPESQLGSDIMHDLQLDLRAAGLEIALAQSPASLEPEDQELPRKVPLVIALGPPFQDSEEEWKSWVAAVESRYKPSTSTFQSTHVAIWRRTNFNIPLSFYNWPVYNVDDAAERERFIKALAAATTPLPTLPDLTGFLTRKTTIPRKPNTQKKPTGADNKEAPPQEKPPRPPLSLEMQHASISDIPATEDALGFAPYVIAVAQFLSDPKTRPPLTISIEGEWGSGKSSFMLQLKEELQKTGAKKFVSFNAWLFDKDEALWASFALQFARQIAPTQWLHRIAKRLALAMRRMSIGGVLRIAAPLFFFAAASWLSKEQLLKFSTELIALIEQVMTPLSVLLLAVAPLSIPLLKRAKDFLENPFSIDLRKAEKAPDYEGRVPFLEQFHSDFQLIADTYIDKGEKVFVFIDDLDRCEVPKAAELLQALNLMIGDSHKLIFILGIDREKVAAAIAMRNEKLLPLLAPTASNNTSKAAYDPLRAMDFGHDFLERFIQLPFRIPRPSEHLDPMLNLLLGKPSSSEHKQPTAPITAEAPAPYDASMPERVVAISEPTHSASIQRRALIIAKADVDSPEVREIMKMVAPVFGANPRRLKKFLNVFRLNAYIGSETGIFDEHPGKTLLTLPKLAKFIAITLRWPKFLDDLENNPNLLKELTTPDGDTKNSILADYWAQRPQLVNLLRFGESAVSEYSMLDLDLNLLRSVSPAILPISLREDTSNDGAQPNKEQSMIAS